MSRGKTTCFHALSVEPPPKTRVTKAHTSIWDKEVVREVLGGPGNLLQLHGDNPRMWDAWDLDAEYRDSVVEITAIEQVERRSGLRGQLAFERKFGDSRLSQTMSLDSGSRVLRFETRVEWRERHKMPALAMSRALLGYP